MKAKKGSLYVGGSEEHYRANLYKDRDRSHNLRNSQRSRSYSQRYKVDSDIDHKGSKNRGIRNWSFELNTIDRPLPGYINSI